MRACASPSCSRARSSSTSASSAARSASHTRCACRSSPSWACADGAAGVAGRWILKLSGTEHGGAKRWQGQKEAADRMQPTWVLPAPTWASSSSCRSTRAGVAPAAAAASPASRGGVPLSAAAPRAPAPPLCCSWSAAASCSCSSCACLTSAERSLSTPSSTSWRSWDPWDGCWGQLSWNGFDERPSGQVAGAPHQGIVEAALQGGILGFKAQARRRISLPRWRAGAGLLPGRARAPAGR